MPVPLLLFAVAGVSPVASLVGQCWRGTLAGGKADTHCFTRGTDGGVRDRHQVRLAGRVIYWGETDYRPAGSGWRFVYRNAGGVVSRGAVRRDGRVVRFADASGRFVGTWRLTPGAYRAGPTLFRRVSR